MTFTDVAAASCDPTNRAPVAAADEAETQAGEPVTIAGLDNDSDPDGDPLEVASVGATADGSVRINPDGTVRFRPDPGFTGQATFTYTVEDGNGGASTATVTVTVTPK